MFAAIGTDGTREVVWGLGATVEEAEQDAREGASNADCDPDLVRTVPVSADVAERIRAGGVVAAELGI